MKTLKLNLAIYLIPLAVIAFVVVAAIVAHGHWAQIQATLK